MCFKLHHSCKDLQNLRLHVYIVYNIVGLGLLRWFVPISTEMLVTHLRSIYILYIYLIQNSQAVKKVCGPQKGYGEKRCEIQGGGQEMAVMVG